MAVPTRLCLQGRFLLTLLSSHDAHQRSPAIVDAVAQCQWLLPPEATAGFPPAMLARARLAALQALRSPLQPRLPS